MKLRVFLGIRLAVERRRDQLEGLKILTVLVGEDLGHDFSSHFDRILDRVGINLPFQDCLLAGFCTIKPNNRDLLNLVRFVDRLPGTQGRGIVDGKDTCNIRVGNKDVCRCLVTNILISPTVDLSDNLDLSLLAEFLEILLSASAARRE